MSAVGAASASSFSALLNVLPVLLALQITEAGFHLLADAVAIAEGQLHHMELGQNPGKVTSAAYRDLMRMLRHTHESAASLTAHGYLAHTNRETKLSDHDAHKYS